MLSKSLHPMRGLRPRSLASLARVAPPPGLGGAFGLFWSRAGLELSRSHRFPVAITVGPRSFASWHNENRAHHRPLHVSVLSAGRPLRSGCSRLVVGHLPRVSVPLLRRTFSSLPSSRGFLNIPPWLVNLVLRYLPRLLPLAVPLVTSALGLILKSLPFIAVGFLMLYATYIVQTSRGIAHWIVLYILAGALSLYAAGATVHHMAWHWGLEPKVAAYVEQAVDAPTGAQRMVLARDEPVAVSSHLTLAPHDYSLGFALAGNPEIPGKPRLWCTYTWEAALTENNQLRPHERMAGRFEAVYGLDLARLFSRGPMDFALGAWSIRSLQFKAYNPGVISNEAVVRETFAIPLPDAVGIQPAQ